MARARDLLLPLLLLGASAAPACSEDPVANVLEPSDLANPDALELPFDRNEIVDSASFTDVDTFDVPAIQQFLARTPYARPSFLETYQSNGIRAADAIVSAARQHRINPIVFLVYAQATQGLVGARNYPFPPERVEYVFRCGCLHSGSCLPELAGFDRQLQCLGHALRTAIDDIRNDERTASGWGPDIASITLDNQRVSPTNDATAALYERTPRVNEKKAGGSWVFWNVWRSYALALEYSGPFGATDGRWIGEACATSGACSAYPEGICADHYPDGMCTAKCTGTCPSTSAKTEAFCAKFPDGGYCMTVCNPSAPACRAGYTCVRAVGAVGDDSKHVCSPEPATSD